MSTTERRPTPRERLSVDRIVEEALRLAEQEGVRGISMRPLAARFNVSATALYGHVASRDALMGLMLDRILADVPPLSPELAWDEALRVGALRMRDAFLPYPQLALEALGGRAATALTRTSSDDLVRRLTEAGFDGEHEAELAVVCWGRWTLSYLAAAGHTPADAKELAEHAFVAGLDLLLDGLRNQLAAKQG